MEMGGNSTCNVWFCFTICTCCSVIKLLLSPHRDDISFRQSGL